LCRHTPEVGAVCGKAARTVLCGGRAMKSASLPLLNRRAFIALLGGAAAWPSQPARRKGDVSIVLACYISCRERHRNSHSCPMDCDGKASSRGEILSLIPAALIVAPSSTRNARHC